MNQLIAFSLCVLAIATTLEAAATQFTTKYDNVNVDEVLGNERLLQKYIDCILDKGKCTADGQELKNALPEAIKNECGGCSEKQKEGAQKVAKHLYEHKKEVWEELLNKYDPDGTFREKYKARYENVLKN
ncbi:hypothetical protein V9T40_004126 [Parthenolecanium corni]|uniref:Uncharacterized protein n=1 Tax=Parthenolecanium corni TaxID=536013 RepID=A0AAN9Y4J2_9HEMI